MTPQQIVTAQSQDDGLWCVAQTAMEGYLQQELRRLHAAVEAQANALAKDVLVKAKTKCVWSESLDQGAWMLYATDCGTSRIRHIYDGDVYCPGCGNLVEIQEWVG